jgi:hypothetical protein
VSDWATAFGQQAGGRTGVDPDPPIFREVAEFLRESGRSHAADELEAALLELRSERTLREIAERERDKAQDRLAGKPAPDFDPRVDHPERYREGPI